MEFEVTARPEWAVNVGDELDVDRGLEYDAVALANIWVLRLIGRCTLTHRSGAYIRRGPASAIHDLDPPALTPLNPTNLINFDDPHHFRRSVDTDRTNDERSECANRVQGVPNPVWVDPISHAVAPGLACSFVVRLQQQMHTFPDQIALRQPGFDFKLFECGVIHIGQAAAH